MQATVHNKESVRLSHFTSFHFLLQQEASSPAALLDGLVLMKASHVLGNNVYSVKLLGMSLQVNQDGLMLFYSVYFLVFQL